MLHLGLSSGINYELAGADRVIKLNKVYTCLDSMRTVHNSCKLQLACVQGIGDVYAQATLQLAVVHKELK